MADPPQAAGADPRRLWFAPPDGALSDYAAR